MGVTKGRRIALAIALVVVGSLSSLSGRFVVADERAASDEAAPDLDPYEQATVEKNRAELMKIPGVSKVYVANDRSIVVRVRKLTPELDQQIPKQLEGYGVRVVDVEDVMRRHLHELLQIAGGDQIFSYGVESFPSGQLAIVVRVRRPSWEQPIKVPPDIEGIPLRVLVAQEPLTQ